MADLDERVRMRAYHLWQQAGAPEGRAEEFWANAEQIERSREGGDAGLPAAGPHARPDLVNEDVTIGSGMLSPPGDSDDANAGPSG